MFEYEIFEQGVLKRGFFHKNFVDFDINEIQTFVNFLEKRKIFHCLKYKKVFFYNASTLLSLSIFLFILESYRLRNELMLPLMCLALSLLVFGCVVVAILWCYAVHDLRQFYKNKRTDSSIFEAYLFDEFKKIKVKIEQYRLDGIIY